VIDWVAIAWFLASGAGALIAGIGVSEAVGDLRALDGSANGRRIIARDYFRTQLGRLAICAVWMLLGLPLLFDNLLVGLNIYTAGLIGSNAALAIFALLSLRDRRTLLH
jgi:hypothetical protein